VAAHSVNFSERRKFRERDTVEASVRPRFLSFQEYYTPTTPTRGTLARCCASIGNPAEGLQARNCSPMIRRKYISSDRHSEFRLFRDDVRSSAFQPPRIQSRPPPLAAALSLPLCRLTRLTTRRRFVRRVRVRQVSVYPSWCSRGDSRLVKLDVNADTRNVGATRPRGSPRHCTHAASAATII